MDRLHQEQRRVREGWTGEGRWWDERRGKMGGERGGERRGKMMGWEERRGKGRWEGKEEGREEGRGEQREGEVRGESTKARQEHFTTVCLLTSISFSSIYFIINICCQFFKWIIGQLHNQICSDKQTNKKNKEYCIYDQLNTPVVVLIEHQIVYFAL